MTLNATTVSTTARDGMTALSGEPWSTAPRLSLIITPQSDVGGWTPSPRKDRAAKSSRAYPKLSGDWASTVGETLGRTRRAAMCAPLKPWTVYADTYGRALADCTSPRSRRATNGV